MWDGWTSWGGAFSPSVRKGVFTDHFVIASITHLSLTDEVVVGVRFDKSPERVYYFYFTEEEYEYNKDKIGQLVQSQLGA